MPIDADFLDKLRCPKSRRPLRHATAEELKAVNNAVGAGEAKNVGGEPVREPLEEGLVPEGEAIVYPVRDAVPVLLSEEAVTIPSA